jgi:hypothetical protein
MTVDQWLQATVADAERRNRPDLRRLLEALARSTRALRAADFCDDASGGHDPARGSADPR